MTSSDRAMVDDLHRIIEIARRVQHGNETGRQGAREIEKIATSRVVLLASPVQGSEDVAELLRGPEAWLDRWATHIGTCPGGERCACGLTLARAEIHQALAAVSKPLEGG